MPTRPDDLGKPPNLQQIRSCLPPHAKHSVLRMMPFHDRAPKGYRRLQDCVYATLASGLSSLDRADALAAFWSLYDQCMPDVPDAQELLVEVAQHVCDTAFTFQAAEILAVAELNQQQVYVDEVTSTDEPVSLPVLIPGQTGSLALQDLSLSGLETLSRAVRELRRRSACELAALPHAERLAAIRLLRLFLRYGPIRDILELATSRALYFDRLGQELWQTLTAAGFEPDIDVHLYGRPAMDRMRQALQAASSVELEMEAPVFVGSEAASRGTVAQLPGLMHLVVRDEFPPPRDSDDQEAMKPYERLRQPMPLARLPSVAHLDQCRTELLKEFAWADNFIDGVFDELRARRLLGGLVLGFSPILLKGPAGSGKSRLARRLGEVLDLPVHTMHLGGSTDAMAILGTNRGWAGAQASPLMHKLLTGRATALIVLDEVDKAGELNRNNLAVESALLPLLDPEEARRWRDGFLQVECDLRCLQWVMTCNDTTWLSSALRSRVRIFEIRRPSSAELHGVVGFAVRDIEAEWGLPAGAFLGVPLAQMLPARLSSLRELRQAVSRAVAAWVNTTAYGLQH